MRTGAKTVEANEILRLLCQGAKPQKKNIRTEPVTSAVMEARQASFSQNPHFGKLPPEPKKDTSAPPKLENSIQTIVNCKIVNDWQQINLGETLQMAKQSPARMDSAAIS